MSNIGERVRRFLQNPGTADLTRLRRLLPQIAAQGDNMTELADDELAELITAEATDDVVIGAALREAAFRAIGERPYDVQLLGMLAMLSGHVAEMVVTSALIPPLSVFWRVRGALQFSVFFL